VLDIGANWPPLPLSGLRIRAPGASPAEWQIHEIMLYSGGHPVPASTQWELHAWPNVWELPLAFDENWATRWRTWEPVRAGMYVEVDFGEALALSGATMASPAAAGTLPFEFYGREPDGWHLLASLPLVTQRTLGDVRMSATRAIRGAGFRYILADSGAGGMGVGAAMVGHEAEWGLEKVAEAGSAVLFRIE
jgi:hypothetical protein